MNELSHERIEMVKNKQFVTNENDFIFEAADMLRMGRDIFVQHGFTTNLRGIEWLRRELSEFRVHTLNFPNDTCPVHIDATFVPVRIPDNERKGIIWVNPERTLSKDLEHLFTDTWDLMPAPHPNTFQNIPRSLCSNWLSMNFLNLDPTTIIMEQTETTVEKSLNSLGIKTIPIPFRSC